jgi:hypothetical protein
MATRVKVPLCFYCGEAPTRTVAYGRGKGRKPKRIARYICTDKKCWRDYYKEVDAL